MKRFITTLTVASLVLIPTGAKASVGHPTKHKVPAEFFGFTPKLAAVMLGDGDVNDDDDTPVVYEHDPVPANDDPNSDDTDVVVQGGFDDEPEVTVDLTKDGVLPDCPKGQTCATSDPDVTYTDDDGEVTP